MDFKKLLSAYREYALRQGYKNSTINSVISKARRFLKLTARTELENASFIEDEERCNTEIDQAAAQNKISSDVAYNIKHAVLQIHGEYIRRKTHAAEAPSDFLGAYKYYGAIAYGKGLLGERDRKSRKYPYKPNTRFLRKMIGRRAADAFYHTGTYKPNPKSRPKYEALENVLKAPKGTFTKIFNNVCLKDQRTDYAKRLRKSLKIKYYIKYADWPQHIRQEFEEFAQEKKKRTWTTRKDGYCGTELITKLLLEAFFGWLCLPLDKNTWRGGLGMKPESIKSIFAELLKPEVYDAYAQFRKARTLSEEDSILGKTGATNEMLLMLSRFTGALTKLPHPTNKKWPGGFVFYRREQYISELQHLIKKESYDELRGEFIIYKTPQEQWIGFCKQSNQKHKETVINAKSLGQIAQSRATDAPIANILALDDPRQAIVELLNYCHKDFSNRSWEYQPRRTAVRCRMLLFIELIAVSPLRLRLWAILRKEHLIYDPLTEQYAFKIPKNEFKNHRFIEEDFHLKIPKRLTALIDTYLNIGLPILNSPPKTFSDGEKLMRAGKKISVPIINQDLTNHRIFQNPPVTKKIKRPISELNITQKIQINLAGGFRKITRAALGEKYRTYGFGPHAIRHIIATAEIKISGSFERAALLLWDNVETVRKAYAHVKRRDLMAGVTADQENSYAQWRHTPSSNSIPANMDNSNPR